MSKKIETLGLVEVTSQRQANNGTVCFYDPIANCDYLSYQSGYIRRKYDITVKRYTGAPVKIAIIYQLNKTRQVEHISSWSNRAYNRTERILVNSSEERLDLLCRSAINYRKYLKSNQS